MSTFLKLDPSNMNKMLVGFDLLFSDLSRLADEQVNSAYPPYNIYKENNNYFIEIAVTGFTKSEISVIINNNKLTVSTSRNRDEVEYIYKGLSTRNFHKEFTLLPSVKLVSAKHENGLLVIQLEDVPAVSLPPQTINII